MLGLWSDYDLVGLKYRYSFFSFKFLVCGLVFVVVFMFLLV